MISRALGFPSQTGPVGRVRTQEMNMARYQTAGFLTHVIHADFDKTYKVGETAPFSGIYRCTVCGCEAVSLGGNTLPPESHHKHAAGQGTTQWQIIVGAVHTTA